LLFLGSALAAPVAARELRIHDFHVELDVMPIPRSTSLKPSVSNSSVHGKGFIGRSRWSIPGPGGFNYSLYLSNVTASDGAGGAPLRIERSRIGPNLQFKNLRAGR